MGLDVSKIVPGLGVCFSFISWAGRVLMFVFLVFIEQSTVREAERAAQSAAGSSGNRRVEVVVVLLLAEHGEVRVVGHRHGVAGFRAPPKLRLREEEAHPFLSEMLRYAFCGILRPEICRKVCVFVLSLQCLKIAVQLRA